MPLAAMPVKWRKAQLAVRATHGTLLSAPIMRVVIEARPRMYLFDGWELDPAAAAVLQTLAWSPGGFTHGKLAENGAKVYGRTRQSAA